MAHGSTLLDGIYSIDFFFSNFFPPFVQVDQTNRGAVFNQMARMGGCLPDSRTKIGVKNFFFLQVFSRREPHMSLSFHNVRNRGGGELFSIDLGDSREMESFFFTLTRDSLFCVHMYRGVGEVKKRGSCVRLLFPQPHLYKTRKVVLERTKKKTTTNWMCVT